MARAKNALCCCLGKDWRFALLICMGQGWLLFVLQTWTGWRGLLRGQNLPSWEQVHQPIYRPHEEEEKELSSRHFLYCGVDAGKIAWLGGEGLLPVLHYFSQLFFFLNTRCLHWITEMGNCFYFIQTIRQMLLLSLRVYIWINLWSYCNKYPGAFSYTDHMLDKHVFPCIINLAVFYIRRRASRNCQVGCLYTIHYFIIPILYSLLCLLSFQTELY